MNNVTDCTCEECRHACESKPGWFKPGEVERVADYLGISLAELFTTKLAVDWWENTGDDDRITADVFVLAPGIVDSPTGTEYPGDPHGQCRFFVDGLCSIHAVKPFECRASYHDSNAVVRARHADVAVAWIDHHKQIVELLGDEPEAEPWSGGLLGMLGGWLSG